MTSTVFRVVTALAVLALAACSSGDRSNPAATSSPTVEAKASSTRPTTPSPPASLKAARPPEDRWDRISRAGEASDQLERKKVPLPDPYWPDRGVDDYDRPYPDLMQRSIAAFLLRVRSEDQETADRFGADLRAVPAAWCSLTLPNRTPAQLDAQVTRATRRAMKMAGLLNTTYRPLLSEREQRLLRFARDEAGRRFCPEQAARPGRRVAAKPRTGAGWFKDASYPVDLLKTPIPYFYASNLAGRPAMARNEVAMAYMAMLTGHTTGESPVLIGCDSVADFLKDTILRETAENIRDLEPTADDMRSDIEVAATSSFALLEEQWQFCR